ncbi:MAG: uracil-DNA glycosylase [Mariprofundus sp.]|nr:uracil-DNA glycosylase [Mariprofundus sp.]
MAAESSVFLETYLREIGVHTPVSLLSFGSEQTESRRTAGAETIGQSVEENKMKASVPVSQKGSDPILEGDVVQQDVAVVDSDMKPLHALALDASTCRLCGLVDSRKNVVFGAGNAQADLLFIGETPKQDEDLQGEPFVGAPGQMLERMLSAIGLKRDDVYIMNAIKCSTPNNRDPRPDEVQACALWLDQQLTMIQPKMICLLGKVAAQTVLKTDDTLATLRGHWHEYKAIPVWVTYHPAYLMRSPRQKQKSWQDLMQLSQRFQGLR